MENEKQERAEAVSQLGGTPEGRVQRYFCIDDTDCQAFSRVSKDVRVVKRTPKRVRVMGREVDGWIVEIVVPPTDGAVRVDPLMEPEKI